MAAAPVVATAHVRFNYATNMAASTVNTVRTTLKGLIIGFIRYKKRSQLRELYFFSRRR